MIDGNSLLLNSFNHDGLNYLGPFFFVLFLSSKCTNVVAHVHLLWLFPRGLKDFL